MSKLIMKIEYQIINKHKYKCIMYKALSPAIPKSVSYRVYTEHLILIFNKFKTHFVFGIIKR